MFVARRIFRKNKFINFISTDNALNCNETKNKNKKENFIENKNQKEKAESKINNTLDFLPEKSFSGAKKYPNIIKHREMKNIFREIKKESVVEVANELGGDLKETTEEIFRYLKEVNILKVSDSSKSDEKKMFKFSNFYENASNSLRDPNKEIFSLFDPLNIFDEQIMRETESQVKLKIWNNLETAELEYLSKQPAKNCFEEMIAWTNEGKLWHFPIDNDQGMENEADISFTKHIFMEQYLEPWCPKKGPLRKFMELVLLGLSKNHIYTLEEKKAHIDWFRRYFEEKRKLLQELGAVGSASSAKEPKEIGVSSSKENS